MLHMQKLSYQWIFVPDSVMMLTTQCYSEMSASCTSVIIHIQLLHCLCLSHSVLCFRYELLTPNVIPKGFMDGKKACEKMVGVMCVQDRFGRCNVCSG
jgi:hypothetical protein